MDALRLIHLMGTLSKLYNKVGNLTLTLKLDCYSSNRSHAITDANIMAASDLPTQSAVISIDASRPFTPRRLIADLLRTRYCVPSSILLVERIETHIPVSKRYRTVRLLLGDGELCIQALLRPEAHRFVDSGQVYAGCYVRLARFEIKSVLVRADPTEEGSRLKASEEMVFLITRDLAVVGWNTAYMQTAGTTLQECQNEAAGADFPTSSQGLLLREKRTPLLVEPLAAPEPAFKDGTAFLREGNAKGCQEAETLRQRATDSHSSHLASDGLSWIPNDLSKPVKLTPLKSIPNLPYKQNWVVNILAIVASLSEVEAATLPPFKQRTARLADPSTSKQVLLTVFLDPDGFTPAVESVVLLLGVKNHRFDGGSLKKYGNEISEEGSRWWFEDPRAVEWCDVDGLKKWWTQTNP